jgi:hypothetical protein
VIRIGLRGVVLNGDESNTMNRDEPGWTTPRHDES